MTFRVLDSSELEKVKPEFSSRGVEMPNPECSFVVGAFTEDGELAGFLTCQPVLHAEPLMLRSKFALRGLVRTLEIELQSRGISGRYFAFADGRVAGMAEAMGMKKHPWAVFSKAVA